MRYRCEYLHLPTRSRLIFTVPIPLDDDGPSIGTAGVALARRAGAQWIEASGLDPHDCIFLSVVEVADKMSVRRV